MLYVLWSLRHQGWMSSSGSYTSVLEDATTFSHDVALERCRRVVTPDEFLLIPVSLSDLRAVRG